MITIILGVALLVGFIVAESVIDWLFIGLYALSAMAIVNNLISMAKGRKGYGGSTLGYLLLGLGTAIVQYFYFC